MQKFLQFLKINIFFYRKILWNCWSDAGPESRIPLLGIYPGAKVVQRTYCSEAQRVR